MRTLAVVVADDGKEVERTKKELLKQIKSMGCQWLGKARVQKDINIDENSKDAFVINIAQDYCKKEDMID